MTTLPAADHYVSAAFRAWTELTGSPHRPMRKRPPVEPITRILVVDTETTTDPTQRLTFGTWLHCAVSPDGAVSKLEEGIFYADDLAETDPTGYQTLTEHVACAVPNVDRIKGSSRRIRFQTRTEFVEQTMWKLGYCAGAHVVMFNKPFDISRLALHAAQARGKNYGWFSFQLWKNELYRPRVKAKHIDSKKALMSYGVPKRKPDTFVDGQTNHGEFLDLRTWAFALTGRGHSLKSACETFHVELSKLDVNEHGKITDDYVDYARRDVVATAGLFEKLYKEHRSHPINLEPTQAYSSASVAKSYLFAMGLKPRLEQDSKRFDSTLLAASIESFYGGRSECRIRKTPVPVELHDFTSMYPTVNTLMNLWGLMTADAINPVDRTFDVTTFLDAVTLETMFDPSSWPRLVGLVEIAADDDVLPVRARYGAGDSFTIGVNPVVSADAHWYTIADAVASKILTGRAPVIRRAIRFEPSGELSTLAHVELRGSIRVDPSDGDFFRTVVEQRQIAKSKTKGHAEDCGCDPCRLSAFLKVLANSGSYGIFSELNPQDKHPDKPDTVTVTDGSGNSFVREVPGFEKPGHMCFPPIATCITGAARLMLAMLEASVTEPGGTYAFCDTDSLAIVATDDGRLVACPGGQYRDGDGMESIRSLTFEQCRQIRERFDQLSPYDPALVPGLLKDECRGVCYAISAKRYVIYDYGSDGRPQIVDNKYSEHGLGHVTNPIDGSSRMGWVRDYWIWLIDKLSDPGTPDPHWFDRVTYGSFAVTSPLLWRPFANFNAGKSYADQIKPFGFMSVVYLSTNFGLAGVARVPSGRLVAPFESDPEKRAKLSWIDIDDPHGARYTVVQGWGPLDFPKFAKGVNPVIGSTYRELANQHVTHPEYKFNGPDGSPCGRNTRGILSRRRTVIGSVKLIGKEANRLDNDDEMALATAVDDMLIYDVGQSAIESVRLVLSTATNAEVAKFARYGDSGPGVSLRTVKAWRSGRRVSEASGAAIVLAGARVAYDQLDRLDAAEGRPSASSRDFVSAPELVIREWIERAGSSAEAVELVASQPRQRSRSVGSPELCPCSCGVVVVGSRARYASAACRQRASRERTRQAG